MSAVDQEKAQKDARYDGYFAVITSELDYDTEKIREVYHRLWRIKEPFRIMKSDFDARPIYLNKRKHIRTHFLICFVTLVILRLIQNGMGSCRLSVERIAERYGEQTVFWKEAVIYACWMWAESSGMRRYWIKKVGRWCRG
ncbi:MAG: transposase [Lachnospiraceae bacterium]|nr:transposase [Lachnospiraceae bacterium]